LSSIHSQNTGEDKENYTNKNWYRKYNDDNDCTDPYGTSVIARTVTAGRYRNITIAI